MRKFFPFYIFFFLLIQVSYSQDSFIKKYGGNNLGDIGYGTSITNTSDDAYVFIGRYSENGAPDKIYIYKTDYSGNLIWGKSLGSTSPLYPREIIETSDSAYLVIGWDNGTSPAVFCLKLDKNGDTLWTKRWGTITYDGNFANKVIQTNDGGFLLVGGASSSAPYTVALVIKANANGDTLWTRHIQQSQWTNFSDAIQDVDSTYILIGSDGDILAGEIYKLHLDINGQVISKQYFACFGYGLSNPSFQMTSNGACIIIGGIYGSGVKNLFQLNDTTNSLVIYHTSISELFSKLLKTSDGGFILSGSSGGGVTHTSFFVKLDSAGDSVWTKALDGFQFRSLIQDNEGDYIATGDGDIQPKLIPLVKIDSSGSTLCPVSTLQLQLSTETISTGTVNFNFFHSYLYQAYMPVSISNLSNQFDYCTATGVAEKIQDTESLTANFSENNLLIDFRSDDFENRDLNVCDINGRNLLLKNLDIQPGSNKYSIPNNLAPGIYFVLLSGSEKRVCSKVVKIY